MGKKGPQLRANNYYVVPTIQQKSDIIMIDMCSAL